MSAKREKHDTMKTRRIRIQSKIECNLDENNVDTFLLVLLNFSYNSKYKWKKNKENLKTGRPKKREINKNNGCLL